MASCHSIAYVRDELVGDPLDVKMFESTKWELEEPHFKEGE
jgi:cation-transporting ATPase 13A2